MLTSATKYDLSHLTQLSTQEVIGPIQDDEALFLFALIRVMRIWRILEIGGFSGYSANNFCKAVGERGIVYTIDINPVPKMAANHVPIIMDARQIEPAAVDNTPLDLIFFDCHVYDVQMEMLRRLEMQGMVTDRTVLALHDINLHPRRLVAGAYEIADGWVHQPVERRMVNDLRNMGYDAFALDTHRDAHGPDLPCRHGLAVMRKFRPLTT